MEDWIQTVSFLHQTLDSSNNIRYLNAPVNNQQATSTFLWIKPESSKPSNGKVSNNPKPWFKTINVGIDFRSRIFVRGTFVLFKSISSNVDFKLWIILIKDSKCDHVWKKRTKQCQLGHEVSNLMVQN